MSLFLDERGGFSQKVCYPRQTWVELNVWQVKVKTKLELRSQLLRVQLFGLEFASEPKEFAER